MASVVDVFWESLSEELLLS